MSLPTFMNNDTALSRSLADSLLEVVQACHNKQRLSKPSTKSKAMVWFESLNLDVLSSCLISLEHDWLSTISEMVVESRRTVKGDENLYALDEEFPNQLSTSGKNSHMSFHRRPRTKRTPWGDDIFPLGSTKEEIEAARDIMHMFGVATLNQHAFRATASLKKDNLLRCLNLLSHGRFLSEPPKPLQDMPGHASRKLDNTSITNGGSRHEKENWTWRTVPWFQDRGYSMIGHFIANKVECLLWRKYLEQCNVSQSQYQARQSTHELNQLRHLDHLDNESCLYSFWIDISSSTRLSLMKRSMATALKSNCTSSFKTKQLSNNVSFVHVKDRLKVLTSYTDDFKLDDRNQLLTSSSNSLDSALFVSFKQYHRFNLMSAYCSQLNEFRAAHYEAKVIESLLFDEDKEHGSSKAQRKSNKKMNTQQQRSSCASTDTNKSLGYNQVALHEGSNGKSNSKKSKKKSKKNKQRLLKQGSVFDEARASSIGIHMEALSIPSKSEELPMDDIEEEEDEDEQDDEVNHAGDDTGRKSQRKKHHISSGFHHDISNPKHFWPTHRPLTKKEAKTYLMILSLVCDIVTTALEIFDDEVVVEITDDSNTGTKLLNEADYLSVGSKSEFNDSEKSQMVDQNKKVDVPQQLSSASSKSLGSSDGDLSVQMNEHYQPASYREDTLRYREGQEFYPQDHVFSQPTYDVVDTNLSKHQNKAVGGQDDYKSASSFHPPSFSSLSSSLAEPIIHTSNMEETPLNDFEDDQKPFILDHLPLASRTRTFMSLFEPASSNFALPFMYNDEEYGELGDSMVANEPPRHFHRTSLMQMNGLYGGGSGLIADVYEDQEEEGIFTEDNVASSLIFEADNDMDYEGEEEAATRAHLSSRGEMNGFTSRIPEVIEEFAGEGVEVVNKEDSSPQLKSAQYKDALIQHDVGSAATVRGISSSKFPARDGTQDDSMIQAKHSKPSNFSSPHRPPMRRQSSDQSSNPPVIPSLKLFPPLSPPTRVMTNSEKKSASASPSTSSITPVSSTSNTDVSKSAKVVNKQKEFHHSNSQPNQHQVPVPTASKVSRNLLGGDHNMDSEIEIRHSSCPRQDGEDFVQQAQPIVVQGALPVSSTMVVPNKSSSGTGSGLNRQLYRRSLASLKKTTTSQDSITDRREKRQDSSSAQPSSHLSVEQSLLSSSCPTTTDVSPMPKQRQAYRSRAISDPVENPLLQQRTSSGGNSYKRDTSPSKPDSTNQNVETTSSESTKHMKKASSLKSFEQRENGETNHRSEHSNMHGRTRSRSYVAVASNNTGNEESEDEDSDENCEYNSGIYESSENDFSVSLDDLDGYQDNHYYISSQDRVGGSGGMGEESSKTAGLVQKCRLLETENAALKDMALRLEAEVVKLRNVMAAQQGMARNSAQVTAWSSATPANGGGGSGIGGGWSDQGEVMSDDGVGMGWTAAPSFGDPRRVALPHGAHFVGRRRRNVIVTANSVQGKGSGGKGLRSPTPPLSSASGATNVSALPNGGGLSDEIGSISSGVNDNSSSISGGRRTPRLVRRRASGTKFTSNFSSKFASRLSREIATFVTFVDGAERRLKELKVAAFVACRREVQSLWPRAQVHLYGSFATELSLPYSDLDLVITLPKVQSEAPAEAPGDLEGRNAIKETWQQVLSRKLRKSSWVEPSSIKIISRTAVPVMKVTTTPTGDFVAKRAYNTVNVHRKAAMSSLSSKVDSEKHLEETSTVEKTTASVAEEQEKSHTQPSPSSSLPSAGEWPTVCLDISFEGVQHNGLLASEYVRGRMAVYPKIRPLVLVLKKELCDFSLSDSYTGGLSSYALFLMVTRYVEEAPANTDVGSLLLGFLDFYGNYFEPRTCGISVKRRCYFDRHSDSNFSPPQFDPLFIEDPLCEGNNAGRNCFRISLIQRIWSDALKALTAAIELSSTQSSDEAQLSGDKASASLLDSLIMSR